MAQHAGSVLAVQPVHAEDDVLLTRAHAALTAAERHGRPWAALWSLRELAVHLSAPNRLESTQAWVVERGDEVAGVLVVTLPLQDNLDQAWPELWVHPRHRGLGVGTALLEHALDVCRDQGRRTVLVESPCPLVTEPDHPHRRFARRHGFEVGFTEVMRVLDLPVGDDRLRDLAVDAATHHPAYRLATFVDGLPEELQESYCRVAAQLGVDAPTGSVDFEPEALTPPAYREHIQSLQQQGRSVITTVALADGPSVVGYNDLVVPDGEGGDAENVLQWGTLVHREHRGHRLGTAVKVRGLQELARRHPARRRVQTCNADDNAPMVAINDLIGFRPVELVVEFLRTLE